MKPTRDGEDVASDMTSKEFPSPIPSPERDKVEEMQPVCVWCDHVLACDHCGTEQPYDDLNVLKAKLSLSEKRAEEAEARATMLLGFTEEAQDKWQKVLDDRENLLSAIGHLQSERDSLRSSLARVVRTASLLFQNAEGCAVNHYGLDIELNGLPGWLSDAKAEIDSALHRSQGE